MKYRSEDTSACLPQKRKNHVAKPEFGVRSDGLQVLKISEKARVFGKTLVSNGQRRATADFEIDTFLLFFTRHAKLFKGNEHWYDRNIPGFQVGARRELEVGNLKKYRLICECKVLQGCKQLYTFDVRALYF